MSLPRRLLCAEEMENGRRPRPEVGVRLEWAKVRDSQAAATVMAW